jgi:hypothetical protein
VNHARFLNVAFLTALLLCNLSLQGQNINVRFAVFEQSTLQPIPGCQLLINTNQFVVDNDGNRAVVLASTVQHSVRVHSLGFVDTCFSFRVAKDTLISIFLRSEEIQLNEITVSAGVVEPKRAENNALILSSREVFLKPSLLADNDLLAGLQQLPGVSGGIDGFAGLYVRGGNIDQNLILLDGIPIYNVYHTFGLFSALPVKGVQQVGLYQSGIPAQYGGYLSSVLDVAMLDGNKREWHGSITGGLVSFSGYLEGPLINKKWSMQVGARKTWLDYIVALVDNGQGNISIPGFGDYHLKTTYTVNKHHKFSLLAYINRDYFLNSGAYSNGASMSKSKQQYGNTLGGLTHEYTKKKVSSTTRLSASTYRFKQTTESTFQTNIESYFQEDTYKNRITEFILQNHTRFQLNSALEINVGVQIMANNVGQPNFTSTVWGSEDRTDLFSDTSYGQASIRLYQFNPHAALIFQKNNWFVSAGFRGNIVARDNLTNIALDPRFFTSKVFAAGRMKAHVAFDVLHQPIQQIRLSRMSLPTDYWATFGNGFPVARSIGGEAGLSFLFKQLDISILAYRKEMDGVFERLESNYLLYDQPLEDLVTPASSTNYGISTSLSYKSKRLTAAASYSYQQATRQSDFVNYGQPFEFEFNQPHMVKTNGAILLKSKGEKRIEFSWFWYWASGLPFTYSPQAVPSNPGMVYYDFLLPYANEKNNYRTPAFHRLDISFRFMKKKEKGMRTFELVFYNVYSRINTFYLSTDFEGNPTVEGTLPFIPMFSYKYDF